MAIDYRQDEVDVLISLIRQDNQNKPLSKFQVEFDEPYVFSPTPEIQRDTMVVATSVADMGYSGSQVFYYNRVPLVDFLEEGFNLIVIQSEGEGLLSEMLTKINDRLGIYLTPDKIIDQVIPESDRPVNLSLEVRSDSYVYSGVLPVRVLPTIVNLDVIIPNTSLNGLLVP